MGPLILFFPFLLLFTPLSLTPQESATSGWQSELVSIDQQLAELQEMQEQLRSSITRKSNNAMRWQFQNENYQDARRTWDQVAREKEQLAAVQKKIDELEARKQEILQEHS